ncbi:MAG: S8 family serine peptidase [Candidatus Doudnabacteria bacterium]|nr:S8 family serine peptidase [Candidatus Doudnabacteria bacterium]
MESQKTIYFKFFAAIMLAVFLYVPQPQSTQAANKEKIILSLKELQDLGTVSESFDLQNLKPLYSGKLGANLFSGEITVSNFSRIKADARIEYTEPDLQVSAVQISTVPQITTNDPFFTTEVSLEDKQWYLAKIRVPEAWFYAKGSGSVVVAVVDTGIHASHLDLNDGRVISGHDMLVDKDIAFNSDSDDNGHGTAVSGVIGAIPNNQKGLAGINWNVSIMPVKALDASGNGELSDISAGIIWAADHGANIINLSLGGSGFPNNITMANAISYAFGKGVLIVAAAGNDTANQGANLDTNPVYPVCADNGQNMVLGVAASDNLDRKATFSNFGINCVDITAPGKKILTTAFLPSDPSNNILIYASGTSLATPVVAGVAALIKAQNPNYTNIQIRNLILKTADNIDALNQDNCLGTSCNGFLGKGRINALLALQPLPILSDTLVRELGTGNIYLVSGGSKHFVSVFVLNQKYKGMIVVDETPGQLANYPNGTAIAPATGTLVKGQTDATVYYIDNGVRRPLTYLVFVSRKFSFANIQVLSEPDLAAIPLADWYWPPDGTLVLIKGNPTVYVMDQQVVRPVTYFVFTQRKLSFTKVISVTPDEFSHVPKAPDAYWLAPLEGTLVKTAANATVFVIENGAAHAVSGPVFLARKYKFSSIKVLPQAEMDVIKPGEAILN